MLEFHRSATTREARVAEEQDMAVDITYLEQQSRAAIAIKEQIEKGQLKGTVIFYGTPAEETIFAKVWMARAGVFDQLDVCMDWHPGFHRSRHPEQQSPS